MHIFNRTIQEYRILKNYLDKKHISVAITGGNASWAAPKREGSKYTSIIENYEKMIVGARGLVRNKKYDMAIGLCDKILKINEKEEEIWYLKGNAYARMEIYYAAVECFDEAININPKNLKARFNRGLAFKKMEDYFEALECFDEILELNSDNKKAEMYRESIWEKLSNVEKEEYYSREGGIDWAEEDICVDEGEIYPQEEHPAVILEEDIYAQEELSELISDGEKYARSGTVAPILEEENLGASYLLLHRYYFAKVENIGIHDENCEDAHIKKEKITYLLPIEIINRGLGLEYLPEEDMSLEKVFLEFGKAGKRDIEKCVEYHLEIAGSLMLFGNDRRLEEAESHIKFARHFDMGEDEYRKFSELRMKLKGLDEEEAKEFELRDEIEKETAERVLTNFIGKF